MGQLFGDLSPSLQVHGVEVGKEEGKEVVIEQLRRDTLFIKGGERILYRLLPVAHQNLLNSTLVIHSTRLE